MIFVNAHVFKKIIRWSLLTLLVIWPRHYGLAEQVQNGEMISIPGGTFELGAQDGDANEKPRTVSVEPFKLMRHEVTNKQFSQFIAATSYKTDAEKTGFGYVWTRSWRAVNGANWRHPNGPNSVIDNISNHPVVQVSAQDAQAYCAWKHLRLPNEMEWEFAAKGTDSRIFPWGNSRPNTKIKRRANFGTLKCCAPDDQDGYDRTAPVGTYTSGASPFGALDMAGNVWEWTSSRFPGNPDDIVIRGGGWGNNTYCLRTSYRHGNPNNIGLDMVGIRCAGRDGN